VDFLAADQLQHLAADGSPDLYGTQHTQGSHTLHGEENLIEFVHGNEFLSLLCFSFYWEALIPSAMAGDEEFDPEMFLWFRFQSWPAWGNASAASHSRSNQQFPWDGCLALGQVLKPGDTGYLPGFRT